jgi:hypothetical protein
VCGAAPLAAQTPVVAQVHGTVFDSVAMTPLKGAMIRIVRADNPSAGRSAFSDSAGVYVYDSVPAGVWLASFLHPTLDSLRLEPGIVRLDITEAGVVEMPLATPSGRTLLARACGPGQDADSGVIVGVIFSADDDAPLAGATIEVEWPEWVLARKQIVTEMSKRRTVSDSLGHYTFCGVPSGSTLRARSFRLADSAGVIEVTIPASGYAVQDFDIGSVAVANTTSAIVRDADTTGAAPVTRGRAIVRGRITSAAGAPLPNAIVRILGNGTVVRSNGAGEFRIIDAVPGTHSLEARAIGYTPERRVVRLRTALETEVSLTLATRRVELDTVRVVAGREVPWDVRSIERRWRAGLGKFIDGKTVVERSTLFATDALRGMPGVFVRAANRGFGQNIVMSSTWGECGATLYVDGLPVRGGGVTIDDFVRPDDVAAIEVYNRPSTVPGEFLTFSSCGVVAVWTKHGTGNVPVLPPKSSR